MSRAGQGDGQVVGGGGEGTEGSKSVADVEESCDGSCMEAMGVSRGGQEAAAGAVGESGKPLEEAHTLQGLGVLVRVSHSDCAGGRKQSREGDGEQGGGETEEDDDEDGDEKVGERIDRAGMEQVVR